jgi:hypothetical protein
VSPVCGEPGREEGGLPQFRDSRNGRSSYFTERLCRNIAIWCVLLLNSSDERIFIVG